MPPYTDTVPPGTPKLPRGPVTPDNYAYYYGQIISKGYKLLI